MTQVHVRSFLASTFSMAAKPISARNANLSNVSNLRTLTYSLPFLALRPLAECVYHLERKSIGKTLAKSRAKEAERVNTKINFCHFVAMLSLFEDEGRGLEVRPNWAMKIFILFFCAQKDVRKGRLIRPPRNIQDVFRTDSGLYKTTWQCFFLFPTFCFNKCWARGKRGWPHRVARKDTITWQMVLWLWTWL